MALNVPHAVARNDYWSRRLSWAPHYGEICSLFHALPESAAEFAEAAAQWQTRHRPPLEPDGIIGPNTWDNMRADLGLGPAYTDPSSPRAEATEEVYTITVHGHTITIFDFINEPGTQAKIDRLREMFLRMPVPHLPVVYPIFLVRRHRHQSEANEGSGGGATMPYRVVRNWSAAHSRNTQIPMEVIQRHVIGQRTGMITIPRHRWVREFGARGGPGFVVPHEIGHCVDAEMRLVPGGATTADFPGVEDGRRFCGHGSAINRQAAEVYRMLLVSPRRLYHFLPSGMSATATNRTILETLRRSRAFNHVPESWGPHP